MELVGQCNHKYKRNRLEQDRGTISKVAPEGTPRQNSQNEILENVSCLAANRMPDFQLFRRSKG
jgi:hypothetical protein